MERVNLLVCDLDGTLLGDDHALDEFTNWYAQEDCPFRLAYASWQSVDAIRELIGATNLPEPKGIIGGIGTEIYDVPAARRVPMWPPSPLGWNPHVVQTICDSHRELKLQPKQFTSYHKVSYCAEDLDQSLIDELWRRMASAGLEVTIICSSKHDLSIVPAGTDKGTATACLARRWNIDSKRVVVAGDSGDDAAMYHAGFRGIVVGNAHPELRALAAPHIYHATAGFAAGVLEGIRYWLQASPTRSAT